MINYMKNTIIILSIVLYGIWHYYPIAVLANSLPETTSPNYFFNNKEDREKVTPNPFYPAKQKAYLARKQAEFYGLTEQCRNSFYPAKQKAYLVEFKGAKKAKEETAAEAKEETGRKAKPSKVFEIIAIKKYSINSKNKITMKLGSKSDINELFLSSLKELLFFHIDMMNTISLFKTSLINLEHQTDFDFNFKKTKHKTFLGIRINKDVINDPIINSLYIGIGIQDCVKNQDNKWFNFSTLNTLMNIKFRYNNIIKTDIGKFSYDAVFLDIIPIYGNGVLVSRDQLFHVQNLLIVLEYDNKIDELFIKTTVKAGTFLQKLEKEIIKQKGIDTLSIKIPGFEGDFSEREIDKISGFLFEVEGGYPIIKDILDFNVVYHAGGVWNTPFSSSSKEAFDLNHSITAKFVVVNVFDKKIIFGITVPIKYADGRSFKIIDNYLLSLTVTDI